MRRLSLLLLFALALLPLQALEVVPAEGVSLPEGFADSLRKAFGCHGGDILPPDLETIEITAVREEEGALYAEALGYTLAFDTSRLSQSIDEEVERFLQYPPFITPYDGQRLDYIHLNTYSSVSIPDADTGEVFDLISPWTGKRIATFTVESVEPGSGAAILGPLKIGEAHAGLELRKTSPWFVSFAFNQVFSPAWSPSAEVRVRNSDWLHPFNPSLGFEAGLARGATFYAVGLAGIEYSTPVGSFVDSKFTLIEDSSLYAGLDVALGWAEGFAWGGAWRVGWRHWAASRFSWGIALDYLWLRSEALDSTLVNDFRLAITMGVRI